MPLNGHFLAIDESFRYFKPLIPTFKDVSCLSLIPAF